MLVDQVEAAARRERLPRAGEHRDPDVGIAVDREPDVGELTVHRRIDRVEPGRVEHDPQDPRLGSLELQAGELLVEVRHVRPLREPR